MTSKGLRVSYSYAQDSTKTQDSLQVCHSPLKKQFSLFHYSQRYSKSAVDYLGNPETLW